MLIRRDRPEDHPVIRAVLAAAFADEAPPGKAPVEIALVDALRAGSEWIPQLSMVAEADGGEVVGYVVCTRGWVDGHPALGLGPLAVLPDVQGRGVGAALMHAVLGAADALEEPLVALRGPHRVLPEIRLSPRRRAGDRPAGGGLGPALSGAHAQRVRARSAWRLPLCRGLQ